MHLSDLQGFHMWAHRMPDLGSKMPQNIAPDKITNFTAKEMWQWFKTIGFTVSQLLLRK